MDNTFYSTFSSEYTLLLAVVCVSALCYAISKAIGFVSTVDAHHESVIQDMLLEQQVQPQKQATKVSEHSRLQTTLASHTIQGHVVLFNWQQNAPKKDHMLQSG